MFNFIKWFSFTKERESVCNSNFHSQFFFFFLGLHLWHVEVPRIGVTSELHLLAYTTATAMQDVSHVCNLHHSSWQHQIPESLSKATDPTSILIDTGWIHFHCATRGTPKSKDLVTVRGSCIFRLQSGVYTHWSGCTLFLGVMGSKYWKFHFYFVFPEHMEGIKLHFHLINVLTLMLFVEPFVRKSFITSMLKFHHGKGGHGGAWRYWQCPFAQPFSSVATWHIEVYRCPFIWIYNSMDLNHGIFAMFCIKIRGTM